MSVRTRLAAIAHRLSGKRTRDLETAVAVARQAVAEMSLVKPPDPDGHYDAGGERFYRSSFNIAWLAELAIAPQTIIDVGSFDAGDAVRFKLAFPQARVIAFEADPDRAAIVKARAARFGVDVIEAAAFREDGEIPWFQATIDGRVHAQGSAYRHNDALNSMFPHVRQKVEPIKVRATRLDTFCGVQRLERIDVLHVDAQGSEHDVITGLGALRPALVYLELDYGAAGWIGAKGGRDIHALMNHLGYLVAADCTTDRLYIPRRLASGLLART